MDVDQPAATLWYHPHLHGETAAQVYRGAAGMFLVDDPAAAPDLPDTYGVDDVPLIVQDKSFDGDGELDGSEPLFNTVGFLGDTIVVNGTVNPHLDVTTERVRLRLLNASNARVYDFGFADDRTFQQVASDAGLLERPYETDRVQLSPGERAEIVVDVEPGERAVLRSFAPDLGVPAVRAVRRAATTASTSSSCGPPTRWRRRRRCPTRLATIDRPDPDDAVRTREFRLGDSRHQRRPAWTWTASTRSSPSTRPRSGRSATPTATRTASTRTSCTSRCWTSTASRPRPSWPGGRTRSTCRRTRPSAIIARFEDHADPTTPYMFHCHVLRHEDQGMMGQFVVVEPGDEPDLSGMGGMPGHDH